jgi:hypothetical protein
VKSQTIQSESWSVWPPLMACVGLAALGVCLATRVPHWGLFALAPLTLAAAGWLFRPRPLRAEITPRGLTLAECGTEIPFAEIESVTLDGFAYDPASAELPAGPIVVVYPGGCLEIPAKLNVPSVEVYRLLLDSVPDRSGSAPLAELADHLRQEEEAFGADKVWHFCKRSSRGPRPRRARQAMALSLVAVGVVWFVAGAMVGVSKDNSDYQAWMGFGMLLLLLSLLTWLVMNARNPRPRWRRKGQAGLIVSPTGIALVQDDLKGCLRWDELREARLIARVRGVQLLPCPPGICLEVSGARIHIPDIYDRPLAIIHQVICRMWGRPTGTSP